SSIVYFNADHVRDAVIARVRGATPHPRAVVCDLSTSPYMDMAAAEAFRALEGGLRTMGTRLHIVEARSSVRARLRTEGLEDVIGRIDRVTTVADAVQAIEAEDRGEDGRSQRR